MSMLSLIAKLKKQKEEEEKKHRQNEETAKIYAQYVKSFDGKGGEEPLKFVRSDVYDPSTGATDSTSAEIISLGPKVQNENEGTDDKDELSASYLSQIEDPQSTFKKPQKSSKVREIDKFIEEIKEKQRVINERKELHKKILTASTEYEKYEIKQKLSQIDSDPNVTPELSSTNIYIGNLSPNVTEDILRIQFSKFGQIVGIRLMPTRTDIGSKPTGSAFVSFLTHEQAEKAKNMMDGVEILNIPCKIGWAKNLIKPMYPQDANYQMSQMPLNVVPQQQFPIHDPNLQNMAFFQVFLPIPYHKKKVIDMMAKYVSEGGKEFEKIIMEKENKNGLFSFIFENYTLESVYYRWKVYSLLQGDSFENWNPGTFRITNCGKVYNPPIPVKEAEVNGQKSNFTTVSKSGNAPLTPELENEFDQILANSTSTRNDVCVAMLFIINNSESAYYLTDKLINRFLDESTPSSNKVALLYILSDVLYNSSCSRQYAWIYRTSIEKRLPEIFDGIKKFKSKSTSKIASQQLIDLVTKLFRVWMEWTVYSPVFMQGLEATLMGSDIESFQTSPEFEQYKYLVSTDDGNDVEYFNILSTFPYMFREDAYKYLLMGIKELKSLCYQRGLVLTPCDRVTLVKRLVMYDKYQYEKKIAEEKSLQMMKSEMELDQDTNMESDNEGSDMDQDDDYETEDQKQIKIQEATAELQKVLMNRASSPKKDKTVGVNQDIVLVDPPTVQEDKEKESSKNTDSKKIECRKSQDSNTEQETEIEPKDTYDMKEENNTEVREIQPVEEEEDDIDDIFAS